MAESQTALNVPLRAITTHECLYNLALYCREDPKPINSLALYSFNEQKLDGYALIFILTVIITQMWPGTKIGA
jgi:hypothetical protein